MSHNCVRTRLKQGNPCIGTYLGLGSPTVAELLAESGLDWLVIETEHNALDFADVQNILMAIKGTATVPLVRVPSRDPVHIQKALDIGAQGIVVPLVRTAAEAAEAVAATRYPPFGNRGFGPLRASRYTLESKAYFGSANDSILTVLIIETREAVENLEAIVRTPGVDALYLGPFDLCLALGLDPMAQPHAEIESIFRRMLELGRLHNVAVGINVFNRAQLQQRLSDGVTMVGWKTDYVMLVDSALEARTAFESHAGRELR